MYPMSLSGVLRSFSLGFSDSSAFWSTMVFELYEVQEAISANFSVKGLNGVFFLRPR